MLHEAQARLGGLHAPAVAVQQMLAQFLFQQAHLPAQGGLGHVQHFGRAREAAALGDAQEIFDLLEVHEAGRAGMRRDGSLGYLYFLYLKSKI